MRNSPTAASSNHEESFISTLPRDILVSIFSFLWASELSAGVKTACKDLCVAALSDERLRTRPEYFIGSNGDCAFVWEEQRMMVGEEAARLRDFVLPVVRDFLSFPGKRGESKSLETVEFRHRDRGKKQSVWVDIPEQFCEGQICGGRWSVCGQRAALSILRDGSIHALIYDGAKSGLRSVLPTLHHQISLTHEKVVSHHLGLSSLSGDGFTLAVIVEEEAPCGNASWNWTISIFRMNGVSLEHQCRIHTGAASCVNLSMTLSADGMMLLFTPNGHRSSRLYSTISGDVLLTTTTNHDMYRTSLEKPEFSALAFAMDNRLVEVRPHYGDTSYDSYDQDELKRKLSMLSPATKYPSSLRSVVIHREVPMWVLWMKQLGDFWSNLNNTWLS